MDAPSTTTCRFTIDHARAGVPVTGQARQSADGLRKHAFPDAFRHSVPGYRIGGRSAGAGLIHSTTRCKPQSGAPSADCNLACAYTYSHSIDDSSSARDPVILDTYDLARARASSNFDQRHLFNLRICVRPAILQESRPDAQDSGRMAVVRTLSRLQSGTPFSPGNGVTSQITPEWPTESASTRPNRIPMSSAIRDRA